jgi:hypothetical protein
MISGIAPMHTSFPQLFGNDAGDTVLEMLEV